MVVEADCRVTGSTQLLTPRENKGAQHSPRALLTAFRVDERLRMRLQVPSCQHLDKLLRRCPISAARERRACSLGPATLAPEACAA